MKVKELAKRALYKTTLPANDVLKVVGVSFDDFKNRPTPPQLPSIEYIDLKSVVDKKIRERIVKLYLKDKEKEYKKRIKINRDLNKINKTILKK